MIALTDSSGNKLAINSYDEYGIPGTANSGRFQYTGQAWLPEIGLYYYKARMYSPSLGRFMQTDPIGYGDGMNWYNYVGGDPINAADPGGTDGQWEWNCAGHCDPRIDYGNNLTKLEGKPSVDMSQTQNSDGTYSWTSGNGYSGTWDPIKNTLSANGIGTYSDGAWDSIIVTGLADFAFNPGMLEGMQGGMNSLAMPQNNQEQKCVYKNASGQCVYNRDKDGNLELDSDYAKKACENYNKMQKSNDKMSAGSYIFGLFGYKFKIPGPLLVVDSIVGGVTTLLSFAPAPPGCDQ